MITFSNEPWTDWQNLSSLDVKEVSQGPGAYVLASRQPIQRFVGVDELGVIDIGETGGLRKRFRDFNRCAQIRGETGHMAGWRYAFLRLDAITPFENLQVRWLECESKDEAKLVESRMLMYYLAEHREQPPLNYSSNWAVCEAEDWDYLDKLIGWED